MKKRIVIFGASPDKKRYSNKALHMAVNKGWEPILVNPKYSNIDGFPVLSSLRDVEKKINFLSIYVSYPILYKVIGDVVDLEPPSIILNPGADEKPSLDLLKQHNLPVKQACTLVLMSTGQI